MHGNEGGGTVADGWLRHRQLSHGTLQPLGSLWYAGSDCQRPRVPASSCSRLTQLVGATAPHCEDGVCMEVRASGHAMEGGLGRENGANGQGDSLKAAGDGGDSGHTADPGSSAQGRKHHQPETSICPSFRSRRLHGRDTKGSLAGSCPFYGSPQSPG